MPKSLPPRLPGLVVELLMPRGPGLHAEDLLALVLRAVAPGVLPERQLRERIEARAGLRMVEVLEKSERSNRSKLAKKEDRG